MRIGGNPSVVRAGSSMQLTRAADYAVRVMIYLASQPSQERFLLPKLAKATQTPESFLSKVLQALCRAGFIASRRGQAGGFEMLDNGRRTTIRQVVEAIDGPIYLNLCMATGNPCHRHTFCPSHPIWTRAQEAMLAVLDEATIQELSSQCAAPEPQVETITPAQ